MKKAIHKGFDFSQLGGFPMNQQRLEWMQAAYTELSGGLAAFFGDNVIVSGCIVNGQTVSDGWIVVDGELLPFVGTITGVLSTFLIRTTITPLTFKDGMQKNVQFSKYAQFGSSDNAIQWNKLTRLPNIKALSSNLNNHLSNKNNPHVVTKDQVGLSNIPNAKTDDPSVSDSNILASSKMVNGMLKDKILTTYSTTINSTTPAINITYASERMEVKNHLAVVEVYKETQFGSGIYSVASSPSIIAGVTMTAFSDYCQISVDLNNGSMNPADKYYLSIIIFKMQ